MFEDKKAPENIYEFYKNKPSLKEDYNKVFNELVDDENNEGKAIAWFLEEADRVIRLKIAAKDESVNIIINLPEFSVKDPNKLTDAEFLKLDKLGGIELEQALSKLSESEQDRYLKG